MPSEDQLRLIMTIFENAYSVYSSIALHSILFESIRRHAGITDGGRMSTHRAFCAIAGLWFLSLIAANSSAQAEKYPAKPVMIITPSGAGAGPDVIARIIADSLTQRWGQQVLVVNRPGAGGLIAAQAVAAAAPDGYSLYMPISSSFTVLPEMQPKLPLDFERDLAPIGLVGEQPMVIAVNPGLGVTTLPELIALARRRPGEIMFGTGRGNLPHMTGELLKNRTNINLTFVPYPSAARAMQDALGGTLAVLIESLSALSGPIKGGTLRPLAVASVNRVPDFPDIPTVAEAIPGIGKFEAKGWFALMAKTGTPEPILLEARESLRAVLGEPAVTQKFQSLGTYPRVMSPEEMTAFVRSEQEVWRPIVKQVSAAQ
jgi:tripartite-type tricarboxylate transporter receptor subunit TctC